VHLQLGERVVIEGGRDGDQLAVARYRVAHAPPVGGGELGGAWGVGFWGGWVGVLVVVRGVGWGPC